MSLLTKFKSVLEATLVVGLLSAVPLLGQPVIGLSSASLSFTSLQGGSNPASQTVGISNTGGGTLNWSAAVNDGFAWLSLSGATSGTNSGTITVVVVQYGLTAGTYYGNIQVTGAGASNSPQNILVTLTVNPKLFSLSQTSLSFTALQGGSNPASQTVGISNTGGGTLNWSAAVTSGAAWLSLSGATSGTNSGTITAVVSVGSLTAGTYNGNIQVAAAGTLNTPQNISVTLTVSLPPAIGLSPASLSFTAVLGVSNNTPANLRQGVSISNTGGGSFSWSASVTSGGAWLSLSGPTSGINSGAAIAVVSVGNLTAAGTYIGNIQVTAAGASNTPQNIPVTLTVVLPVVIGVSPYDRLFFNNDWGGSNPPSQTVGISITGGVGTLSWSAAATVTNGPAWLSLSGPTSGGTSGTITAVVNLGSLTAGTYNGNITVTAAAAGVYATYLNIPVTLTVYTNLQAIGLSPASLSFTAVQGGSSPANQTVGISNAGGGTLSWVAAVTSGAFLSLSGATSGTNSGTITAVVSVGGLTAGTYNGNIQVTAAGASNTPQNIPVTLTVNPPAPVIGVSPISLSFTAVQGGSNPANQTVGISITGVGTLSWSAAVTSGAFLSLSGATSGTSSGTITAVVSVGSLTAGTYNGNIQVTAAGASNTPQNIPVTLTVGAPAPVIGVSPASLSFTAVQGGSNPSNQTVGISNADVGTLSWSAAVTSGAFLSLSGVTSGTNSGTITAVVSVGSLTAGTYNGNIQVTAAGAANTPQNIPVTLTVSPPAPAIGLSPASLSFTAAQGGSNPANQTVGISNTGGGTLSWSAAVTSGAAFLSLGGTISGSNSGTITAVVSVGSLTAGTYNGNIQVTAAGAANTPQNIPVTLTVGPAAPVIGVSPASLSFAALQGGSNPANQTVGISITGVGTLSWSAVVTSGAFLSLSGVTSGTNSGTITAVVSVGSLTAGTYNGNIQVAAPGAANTPQNIPVSLTVNPLLTITSTLPLPVGTLNSVYPATSVTAIGGTGSYTWSATGLPPGLSIGVNTGTITGTPTTNSGSPFSVQVTVTDSARATASQSFSLTIDAVLTVTGPSSLPAATVHTAYTATTVTATGGRTPYTWSATGLPPGLSIGIATGTITGTPTMTMGSPFTVQVTAGDGTGDMAIRSYTLVVDGPLSMSGPRSLPAGIVGVAYTATTLTAAGGSTPYTWSATGLPPGLSIGIATGAITGTPTTIAGSPFSLKATVIDGTGDTASNNWMLVINPAVSALPEISSVSNAAGGQTSVAPNTWVSIYGSNFAPASFTDDWSKSIVNGELPTKLDGVSVNVGDQAAYVSYVSAAQINVLLPDVGLGDVPVTVTTPAGASTPVYVNSEQYGAAFFTWPNNQPVATHIDYTLAAKNGTFTGTTTVPAKPGEVIILWGTGFGPTTPTAPAGVPIPVSPVYNTASPVAVMIDNVPASVYGTALASGCAGLYEVVVTVPASLPDGDYTVIAINIDGSQAPPVTLTVSN